MSTLMTFEPSHQKVPVEEGQTILDAALKAGITLPYGCRNGACGACKGQILSGRVTHQNLQSDILPDSELAAGIALFCCAYPQEDIVIECPSVLPAGMPEVRTMPCRVEQIERKADVVILKFRLPAGEKLEFRAGQYIDIQMKDGTRRSFSLANAPHENGILELHIRHVPGGKFSAYAFELMQPREIMRFTGPLGTFFLREDSQRPVILLASGTGFAPIKAMVEHAIHQGITRPFSLYWGARHQAELYALELAETWAKTLPDFSFTPVLSDELADSGWTGRTGLVHQAVLEDLGAHLAEYEVYACGAPIMVESAHRDFLAQGLAPEAFFSDAFFLSNDATPKP